MFWKFLCPDDNRRSARNFRFSACLRPRIIIAFPLRESSVIATALDWAVRVLYTTVTSSRRSKTFIQNVLKSDLEKTLCIREYWKFTPQDLICYVLVLNLPLFTNTHILPTTTGMGIGLGIYGMFCGSKLLWSNFCYSNKNNLEEFWKLDIHLVNNR